MPINSAPINSGPNIWPTRITGRASVGVASTTAAVIRIKNASGIGRMALRITRSHPRFPNRITSRARVRLSVRAHPIHLMPVTSLAAIKLYARPMPMRFRYNVTTKGEIAVACTKADPYVDVANHYAIGFGELALACITAAVTKIRKAVAELVPIALVSTEATARIVRFLRGSASVALAPVSAHLSTVYSVRGFAQIGLGAMAYIQELTLVREPDYRTIFIRNDASTTRMRTFRQQPAEILTYDVDFSEWLIDGDEIESAQFTVVSAVGGDPQDLDITGIEYVQESPTSDKLIRAKVWLSGGTDRAVYKITARMDTALNRRKEVDFRLQVREV